MLDVYYILLYFFPVMLNERLQEWLNLSGTSRAALAEKLNVGKRTVDSWLGKVHRPIPARLKTTIERIIAPPAKPGCIAAQLNFNEEEWERLTAGLPDDIDKVEFVKQRFMAIINAMQMPKS